jgi:hypothetical protein
MTAVCSIISRKIFANLTMHRNITFKRMTLDFYQFIRAQKAATRLLGAQFHRSRRFVEIDITYRCNLKCNNCNRSCTQAPSKTDMPLETIESFLNQSLSRGIKWQRIRILGGEPTLHPQLVSILQMLLAYKSMHNPGVRIVLCTNGAGKYVAKVLAKLPEGVVIKSTAKARRQRLFRPFNLAPVDSVRYRFADFTAGCRILSDCGLGLTPSGYYACAVAGGIDRVFGRNMGSIDIPDDDDDMRDQMNVFCRLCGHFGFQWPTRRQKTSNSWKIAYRSFRNRHPGSGSTKSVNTAFT